MADKDRYGLTRRDQNMAAPFNDFLASPFSMMRRMADEMNQMFNTGMGTMRNMMPNVSLEWPSVDVRETAGSYVVEAEVPGVQANDIDVHMRGDNLVIRGQSNRHQESQDQGYHITERHYGSFYREIPLPGPVDTEHCSAHYENGVLDVRLPKAEMSGQRIPVSPQGHTAMEGSKMGQTGQQNQQNQQSDQESDRDQVVPGTGERASQPGVEASTADQSYVGQKGGESAKEAAQAFMNEPSGSEQQAAQTSQSSPGSGSSQGSQS